MHLLPFYQQTIVLPYEAPETVRRLQRTIRPLEKGVEYAEENENKFLFNGWLKEGRFRISRKVSHPENFLPLMSGRIEGTSVGSILFVRYRMFSSVVMFLIFWSLICLLLSLFFLLVHQETLYALLSFGLGVINYVISTKNFFLQVRSSQKALDKALNG
ncbi:hypothetical protein [Nafulsella turpanensis]|uniref:hypothetical protein n=1 Tax=Nafulsella turpanensis TaxID=1265690 RepID=UPI000345D85C|nr:hypothetical protein [Nafulsella turpanensis]